MSNRKGLAYYMHLPYRIVMIPDEERATFTAVMPDLEGCLAFGKTVAEAYQMITEAQELWIKTALKEGWEIPEPLSLEPKEYSGKFNVRLPRYLHRELVAFAESEGTSLNQLVVALLSEGIKRRTPHGN